MLHDLFSQWLRYCAVRPCFRIYGKGTLETNWRTIDVLATHRRNSSSRWPMWAGVCITWTNAAIAVGWDFAEHVLTEQASVPASRDHPVEIMGGRLRGPGRTGLASASEVLAHECGHTWQACRMGTLYWVVGAMFTRFREGPHWWNHFENQASEMGQFGGIVNGSVCPELMERLSGGRR